MHCLCVRKQPLFERAKSMQTFGEKDAIIPAPQPVKQKKNFAPPPAKQYSKFLPFTWGTSFRILGVRKYTALLSNALEFESWSRINLHEFWKNGSFLRTFTPAPAKQNFTAPVKQNFPLAPKTFARQNINTWQKAMHSFGPPKLDPLSNLFNQFCNTHKLVVC